MTFQTLYDNTMSGIITPQAAYDEVNSPEKLKKINFYKNYSSISQNPLTEDQLQELMAIVGVLQILYDCNLGSPIDDTTYDILEEELVNLGIPRNNSSIEINDSKKVSGKFTNLRGTLDKVYYLYPDEFRTNKSRKTLDEWLKSTAERYYKRTGEKLDFNNVEILISGKMDGCVPGNTQITLASGDTMTIAEIVNGNISAEVLTYNESTGALEAKTVVNWYKYKNDRDVRWKRIKVGKRFRDNCWKKGTDSRRALYVTDNHHMLVWEDGKLIEKLAEEIKVGDIVSSPRFVLSNIQEQVVRGSILGDGCITPHPDSLEFHGTQALDISHVITQKPYLEWKKELLGYLAKDRYIEIKNRHDNDGSYSKKPYCELLTHRSPNITLITDEVDNYNNIPIPLSFLERMNSLGIAIWYMDDGSLNNANPTPRANFHTEAFSYEQQEILKKFLDSRGYFCNIVKVDRTNQGKKIYYILTLTPEGSKNLWTDISHFIVPSMQYKIPNLYRNRFQNIQYDIDPDTELDFREVVSIEDLPNWKVKELTDYSAKIRCSGDASKYRYDIEVEDNHNYFANNILVHNCSIIQEIDDKGNSKWITRGDTNNNLATDVTHIMRDFNSKHKKNVGIKYECMMSEEDKDEINRYWAEKPYKNSRQAVTATLNSVDLDYKSKFLTPIPLKEIEEGEELARISPDHLKNFPTLVCKFSDRDTIKDFADKHKYIEYNGKHYRTDGAVLTIIDPKIQKALGRENNINKFEVAYKFTEESAYTRVKDVEFYVSEFGYITPVLVVNDVVLKGNTINHISLSNIERFRELDLHYGDEVKVLYDIIPYVIKDANCQKSRHPKIEFTPTCPLCHSELDLSGIQVKCTDPHCPSHNVGRVLNYCTTLKIKNLGWNTLYTLYQAGLLNHGIVSLYKIRKNADKITDLDGFGKLKVKKIINEIDAKKVLYDYEFFGALGIEGLNTKTFRTIFSYLPLEQFLEMFNKKKFEDMRISLIDIPGISINKASAITNYLEQSSNSKMINKLLKEIIIRSSYSNAPSKGRIVFTGIRPSKEIDNYLTNNGWEVTDSWSNKAKYLVVPSSNFTSRKVEKARELGIPIINVEGNVTLAKLKKYIKNL